MSPQIYRKLVVKVWVLEKKVSLLRNLQHLELCRIDSFWTDYLVFKSGFYHSLAGLEQVTQFPASVYPSGHGYDDGNYFVGLVRTN